MDAKELHLLYILLDSNLPTGGFVSSSGLESYAKHGFLARRGSSSSSAGGSSTTSVAEAITEFSRAEVENYHSTTSLFVSEAWVIADSVLRGSPRPAGVWHGKGKRPERNGPNGSTGSGMTIEEALEDIQALDQHHEACLLSHVTRRASKAQGIAMLTLYSRGLSRPPGFQAIHPPDPGEDGAGSMESEQWAKTLVDGYKRLIRTGASPGHLAICWGVMTAALGLPGDRALHLHLFLHARSLLSSAVRLNLIGPYLSSQLLLHPFEDIIASQLKAVPDGNTQERSQEYSQMGADWERDIAEDDPWAWTVEAEQGPAATYPLGEILMARHDLQHSRIFNS